MHGCGLQLLNRYQAFVAGREAQICAAILLLAALADWLYGYYQFLRWAVCATAAFCAWKASEDGRTAWLIGFIGLALLFNPFYTIHFRRSEWAWIDALVALTFLAFSPAKPKGAP